MSDDADEWGEQILRARDMGAVESAKVSLANWRDSAGLTLGFAVFVDLMFLMAGWWLVSNTTGAGVGLGAFALLAGIVGLLEKGWRRR